MSTQLAEVQPAVLTELTTTDIMMNVPLLMQIDQMATRMASAKGTIPAHLVGNEGDCWAVIMQAMQWRMNPFAVAQKTHIVSGRLGYEAQLVNAVVQNSGLVVGPFRYEYQGEGNALECRVGAVIKGDSDITWNEWLCIGTVKVKNSPLWATNPKQQMGYLQLKNWARAYTPGPILGVYTPDELQDIPVGGNDSGPAISDLNKTLKDRADSAKVVLAEVVDTDDKPADTKGKPPAEPEPEEEPLPLAANATYANVMQAINDADSPETMAGAKELMIAFCGEGDNDKFQQELGKRFRERLAELKGK